MGKKSKQRKLEEETKAVDSTAVEDASDSEMIESAMEGIEVEDTIVGEELSELLQCVKSLSDYLGLELFGSQSATKQSSKIPQDVPFPASSVYDTLNDGQKVSYVNHTVGLAEKTMGALRDALTLKSRLLSSKADVAPAFLTEDDQFLQTIEVDSGLPMNKRYAEMSLWKYIMRTNQKLASQVSQVLTQDKLAARDQLDDKRDLSSFSFRDYYMGHVTSAFGDELNQIRQDPEFNSSHIPLLIDSLETGVDVVSELQKLLTGHQLQPVTKGKKKPVHAQPPQ